MYQYARLTENGRSFSADIPIIRIILRQQENRSGTRELWECPWVVREKRSLCCSMEKTEAGRKPFGRCSGKVVLLFREPGFEPRIEVIRKTPEIHFGKGQQKVWKTEGKCDTIFCML